MRCNNCGYDNTEGAIRCEKCNAPLNSSIARPNNPTPTPPKGNSRDITGTIPGKQPNQHDYLDEIPSTPEKQEPKRQEEVQEGNCPQCGYELMVGALRCPECKQEVEPSRKKNNDSQSQRKQKPLDGTVSPWQQVKYDKFYLKPMERDGESEQQVLEFAGDEITLNRANLEEGNMTITSKTQAVIENRNGKWYITDESVLQTTFLHISESRELKSGDIILMGDRKFQFDC